MYNMFPQHRLRLGSLLPVSAQDRNPSLNQSPSPAVEISHKSGTATIQEREPNWDINLSLCNRKSSAQHNVTIGFGVRVRVSGT